MRNRRYWVNRTMCDVLDDMRKCHNTHNYAPLLALIEELQYMGNRMEAALEDKNDLQELNEEWHDLKKKVKKLRRKRAKLKRKETRK